VGCGNGFFTSRFIQICDTYGIDSSKKMVELNPHKNVSVMDARQIEYQDDSFDIVFCHALLHHVLERDRVIQEMKRVSKKMVVLLEPNRNNPLMFLFALMVREEKGVMDFSLKYLRNLAERNDLKVRAGFSQGCIVPNKFPTFLLPCVRKLDCRNPLGITNFMICEKS
jgi:ubiquinone/menaquinone biosynthesis C-methylase UbiE